ncbi:MAG: hypothetical protein SFV51_01365 [Bryobacteraceae bacterium]|nr:hypothetical protein [Bryobacteraceae bacterium]
MSMLYLAALLSISAQVTLAAEKPDLGETLRRIVDAAKDRDKAAKKEEEEAHKRVLAAQGKAEGLYRESRRKGSAISDDANYYWREKQAFEWVRGIVRNEREALRAILFAARYGMEAVRSRGPLGVRSGNSDAGTLAANELETRLRREQAIRRGATEQEISALTRAVSAYRQAQLALRREHQTIDNYLREMGLPSIASQRKKREEQAAVAVAQYEERQLRQARDSDEFALLAGMLAALVVTAVALDSTPRDKAAAEKDLQDLKDSIRTACVARGGTILGGFGSDLGTCTR